jgi:hypothetical protein
MPMMDVQRMGVEFALWCEDLRAQIDAAFAETSGRAAQRLSVSSRASLAQIRAWGEAEHARRMAAFRGA